MHMNHNGASKTLIRLIDGVNPISDLIHSKLLQWRQQSGLYSAPEPPTTAALPQNIPLGLLMRLVAPLWMVAVHDEDEEEGGVCIVAVVLSQKSRYKFKRQSAPPEISSPPGCIMKIRNL